VRGACKYNAIDLDAKETKETIDVSSAILATGWRPYPIEKLTEFGGGSLKDVIANVNMERMVSETGPTGGKILKPSNGEPPKRVAFVQCAGSRDVNHLPYCSAVCCLASLKQAIYVREQIPESEVTIYYIDRRAPGRNEDMLTRVAKMERVRMVKGKVGEIKEGQGGALKLKLEDVEAGRLLEEEADLVVLATGMVSNLKDANLPFNAKIDDDGFGLDDMQAGVFVAGVTRRPEDVAASTRDATGAAAKSIIAARRRA
jgi:quinone-modifying oxidoreductase subunit QmoA